MWGVWKSVCVVDYQIAYSSHIMIIRSSRFDMMNQTAFTVCTDMCLVSEVPCFALFCRMCLRIPLFLLVLCK